MATRLGLIVLSLLFGLFAVVAGVSCLRDGYDLLAAINGLLIVASARLAWFNLKRLGEESR